MSKSPPAIGIARRALVLSFLVIATLGAVVLAARWSGQGNRAVQRPALFIGVMLAVHLVGYFVYCGQTAVRDGRIPSEFGFAISPRFREPIIWAAAQQLFAGVFAAMLLCDCGRIVLPAAIGHWLGSFVILVRRPTDPSKSDLQFVKYGFWFTLGTAAAAARLLGRIY